MMYSTFNVQRSIDFTEQAGDTQDPYEKPASTLGSDFSCFGVNKKMSEQIKDIQTATDSTDGLKHNAYNSVQYSSTLENKTMTI